MSFEIGVGGDEPGPSAGGEAVLNKPTKRNLPAEIPEAERKSKRLCEKANRLAEMEARQLEIRKNTWTKSDRKTLLHGLRLYGSKSWEKISELLPEKSLESIKSYIENGKMQQNYCIKRNFMTDEKKKQITLLKDFKGISSNQGSDEEIRSTSRSKTEPIESWLEILENVMDEKEPEGNQLENPSVVVPTVLKWIADFEKQPSVEETGGVDYPAIYRTIACLCEGEAPPQLDPLSARKLMTIFPKLVNNVHRQNLSRETYYLENYQGPLTKNVNSHHGLEPSKKAASLVKSLCDEQGMNPLGFPIDMFFNKTEN